MAMVEDFRPRLVGTSDLVRVPEGGYVLRDFPRGAYLPLKEDAAFVLSLIDGKHSLKDLVEGYHQRYKKLSVRTILSVMGDLSARGFLANPEAEIAEYGLPPYDEKLIGDVATHRRGNWLLTTPQTTKAVAWICSPKLLIVTAAALSLAVGLGIIRAIWSSEVMAVEMSANPFTWHDSYFQGIVGLLLATSAARSLHALWVGSALEAMGGSIYGGGLGLALFLPYIGVDTRDAVALGKRGRVGLALAGLGAHAFSAGLGVVLMLGNPDSFTGFFGRLLAMVGGIGLFIAASPYVEGDLSRLIGQVTGDANWRENASNYLRRKLLKRFLAKDQEGEMTFYYMALYGLFWLIAAVAYLGQPLLVAARELGADWAGSVLWPDRVTTVIEGPELVALSALLLVVVAALIIPAGAFVIGLLQLLTSPVTDRVAYMMNRPKASSSRGAAEEANIESELGMIPLFANLTADELRTVAKGVRIETYEKGRLIIREGDAGDAFYAVREGEVEVFRENTAGTAMRLAVLGKGDGFGEIALLQDVPRTASVRALTSTQVFVLGRAEFEEFVKHSGGGARITDTLRNINMLRQVNLFSDLSAADLHKLAAATQSQHFDPGDVIVREGDIGDMFYVITAGTVAVRLDKVPGGPKHLADLSKGQYFGEIALLKNVPRTATVVAKEPTETLTLGKPAFMNFVNSHFSVGMALEEVSARREHLDGQVSGQGAG